MTLLRCSLAIVCVLGTGACTRGSTPASRAPGTPVTDQRISVDTVDASAPIVDMGCNEAKPRTPIATVRFRPQRTGLDSARLQITIYKDGFTRGRFASLGLSPRNKASSLEIASTVRSEAPNAFAFQSVDVSTSGENVVVRIEKLEPGLNYFWRVVEPGVRTVVLSRPTRAQAFTCPADERP